MRLMTRLLALLLIGVAWGTSAAAMGPQANYLLRCSGCHGADGTGAAAAGIPPFPHFIGTLAADDDGRSYMMHVPGVVASSLSDDEIAGVLNYLLDRWGDHPAAARFTPAEVTRRRALAMPDLIGFRRALVKRLATQGQVLAEYPWP